MSAPSSLGAAAAALNSSSGSSSTSTALRVAATAAVATAAAAAVAAGAGALALRARRRHLLGTLPVTSQDVAFQPSASLTLDRHSLTVNGDRVVVVSGEFHYWRVPDRSRWERVLRLYKSAGLNCIRIYFHWGYHSPAEGVYHFHGNRDIEYLLTLCEKLRLYVMAAPGPYICAETQGGGHPIWLLAKKNLGLRHSFTTYWKEYDPDYSEYCAQWLDQICPILARHQVTVKKGGCVIAYQVENEVFETISGFPLGITVPFGPVDGMRFLAKRVRDLGINVPFFHNDAWEEGSFVAREPGHKVAGKETFGLDIYGFDKYVVFAPTTAPLSTVSAGEEDMSRWKPWDPSIVEEKVDGLEKRIRGFGGTAATAPILVAELQGGWFNQYQHKCTYDDIYNYYGEDYQRLLFDCMLSQGVTMMSYYMFYGGTNWGALGDPDVYTSYDYSACVREWMFLSGRGRKLRLGILFARSFGRLLSATDLSDNALTARPARAYNRSRRTVDGEGASATFHFLRNFAGTEAADSIEVDAQVGGTAVPMCARLPYRASSIALGDYTVAGTDLRVVLSTLGLHSRMAVSKGVEVWVVQSDGEVGGELLVEGGSDEVKVTAGTLEATAKEVAGGAATLVTPGASKGWFEVSGRGGRLLLVAVTGSDVYTLTGAFEAWRVGKEAASPPEEPASLAWGAFEIQHDAVSGEVHVETRDGDKGVYMLLGSGVKRPGGFAYPPEGDPYRGVAGLVWRAVSGPGSLKPDTIALGAWEARTSDLDGMPWIPLPLKHGSLTEPALDTIDLRFTSGHVLYRISFPATAVSAGASKSLYVDLDIRNRCRVYLNGTLVGGHTTYSHLMFRPGVKNGPDPFAERVRYRLPSELLLPPSGAGGARHGWNRLVVVCESWGFPRMAFWLNDCRNPRGVLSARFSSKAVARAARWEVAGVDVSRLDIPYESTGFPDERAWTAAQVVQVPSAPAPAGLAAGGGAGSGAVLRAGAGGAPRWYRTQVTLKTAAAGGDGGKWVRVPLRVYMSGPGDAHLIAGGLYVGRYYGDGDAPQTSFPVPESLLDDGGTFELALVVYPAARHGRANGDAKKKKKEKQKKSSSSEAVDEEEDADADWVSLHVVPWHVDAATWSGNAKDVGGTAFATRQYTF